MQRKNALSVRASRQTGLTVPKPTLPLAELYLIEGRLRRRHGQTGAATNRFQAILLRGKILNVEKAMEYKIYENEEIRNIYTALGVFRDTAKEGRPLNMDKIRYTR